MSPNTANLQRDFSLQVDKQASQSHHLADSRRSRQARPLRPPGVVLGAKCAMRIGRFKDNSNQAHAHQAIGETPDTHSTSSAGSGLNIESQSAFTSTSSGTKAARTASTARSALSALVSSAMTGTKRRLEAAAISVAGR